MHLLLHQLHQVQVLQFTLEIIIIILETTITTQEITIMMILNGKKEVDHTFTQH